MRHRTGKAVLIHSPFMTTLSNVSEREEQVMADLMTLRNFEALGPFRDQD